MLSHLDWVPVFRSIFISSAHPFYATSTALRGVQLAVKAAGQDNSLYNYTGVLPSWPVLTRSNGRQQKEDWWSSKKFRAFQTSTLNLDCRGEIAQLASSLVIGSLEIVHHFHGHHSPRISLVRRVVTYFGFQILFGENQWGLGG